MPLIDYIQFTKKPTEHGVVHEHAEVPTFTLAAYFEALLNPGHPEHQRVRELAEQIQTRAHEESRAHGREMMRHARANMSDHEWSLLVD